MERKARIQSPGVHVGRLCDLPKCSKMGYMSDSTNSIISEGILEVSGAQLGWLSVCKIQRNILINC